MEFIQNLLVEAKHNDKINDLEKEIGKIKQTYQMIDRPSSDDSTARDKQVSAVQQKIDALKSDDPAYKQAAIDRKDKEEKERTGRRGDEDQRLTDLEAKEKEMAKTLPPKFEKGTDAERLQKYKYAKVVGDIRILKKAIAARK